MNKHNITKKYISKLNQCLDEISLQSETIELIVNIIFDSYKLGGEVFILGNGGSATTASHCALSFEKDSAIRGKPHIRAKCLSDSMGLVTAWANDSNYASVFEQQLVYQINKNDVVIAISGSGNSTNIIVAAEYAKSVGAKVIGMVGFSGGRLKDIADICITLTSRDYGPIEDTHLAIVHIITESLKEKLLNE